MLVGNGAKKYQTLLQNYFSNAILIEDIYHKQTASSIAKAGFYHYKLGLFGNSNFLTPLYLRKSQAERALEGEK